MAKKTVEETKPVVTPSIKIAGHQHPWELQFPQQLTAVGFVRLSSKNTYVSFTMKTEGDRIVSIVCDEPNMRLIAEESAKMAFVTEFSDQEEE